jgi:hypothetical protein
MSLLRMRSFWSRVGPTSTVTSVLLKRDLETDTHMGEKLCEEGGKG